MKDALARKNKSVKAAIERYNTYARFVEAYTKTKSLDAYANHVRLSHNGEYSEMYEHMLYCYDHGNSEPLLSNLYDRLLAADEYKKKVTEELRALLREIK